MSDNENKPIEVPPSAASETNNSMGNFVKEVPSKVVRLEVEVKPEFKSKLSTRSYEEKVVDDYSYEPEIDEVEWATSEDAQNKSVWMLIIGIFIVILSLASIVCVNFVMGGRIIARSAPIISVKDEVQSTNEDPEQWFNDRVGTCCKEALELLDSFTSAKTDRERSRFVRNPEFYLKNSSQFNMSSRPRIGMQDKLGWNISHTADKAYLRLDCEDEEFRPFTAYFTREGDTMKLDVVASSAWSEISLGSKSLELAEGKSAILRCLISRKEEFYSGEYNEVDHASYLLKSPDQKNSIWAYVERGSDLDNKLKDLLDHGSFVVSLKKNVRVTIRVSSNKKPSLLSQVRIEELLHKEWVTP